MADASRRKAFLTWFLGPAMKGDRESLIRTTCYTKGRISQLFNESEPFGERAARELSRRLGLDD